MRSIIEAYESGALGKNKDFNYFKFVVLTSRRQSNVTDFENKNTIKAEIPHFFPPLGHFKPFL